MKRSNIMRAILTKYLGATSFRGSRILAIVGKRQRHVVPWDYDLAADQNHVAAAKALCCKLGWTGSFISGEAGDDCYAHVFCRATEDKAWVNTARETTV